MNFSRWKYDDFVANESFRGFAPYQGGGAITTFLTTPSIEKNWFKNDLFLLDRQMRTNGGLILKGSCNLTDFQRRNSWNSMIFCEKVSVFIVSKVAR
jgi:hypothetical protein